jgi:ribosomal protein L29
MKKKDKTNITDTDLITLKKQALELANNLAARRVNRYTKQSKNTREDKILRQKLAIILTVIRNKELANG